MWYNEHATQFYTHFLSKRAYVGKNVGFACHIRLDVKLCSNNERNCVFRCVVSATHLLFGGTDNEKITMDRVALGVNLHTRFVGV